jgi:hypothetical protein
MRLRAVAFALNVSALTGFFGQTVGAQQNTLGPTSDSVSSAATRRADRARRDDPKDPRRDPERARVSLAPVTVTGRPGSLEVVGIPIPRALADIDGVRYRVVPIAGARVIGRSEGVLTTSGPRAKSLMVTVSSPAASLSGRVRIASAEFDGPVGTQPVDVPIEMTVLAVRRVEVTVVDQVVGTRRGDVATIRYRAVNFGNVADSVRFSAQLPSGWRFSNATSRALPTRGAADGSLRIWVPSQAATGTSIVRIVASSGGNIVSAVDVRVEVENPNVYGAQGPKLTVASAITNVNGGPSSTAYVATLEGQLTDSVSMTANGAWRPSSPLGFANDLAMTRLGIPMTPPSFTLDAPRVQLGLGLTSSALSDLTGAFVIGSGISAGTRLGAWRISAIQASPYVNRIGAAPDTGDRGTIQTARLDHAAGGSDVYVAAAHLDNPIEDRRLDAASLGASFTDGPLEGLSSELGYRRAASVSGLGFSSGFRRQGDDGSFELHAMYTPGGVKAYARATNELTASGSRRLSRSVTLNGSYWQSGDRSSTIGASTGDGWSFGPALSLASLGTNLMVQARRSTLEVNGDGGHFGSEDQQLSAIVDVRRGALFLNGSGGIGEISRSVASAGIALPDLTGMSADLRGSFGAGVAGGTVRIDLSTQQYSGGAGIMPRRSTFAVRADRISIPVTERLRIYASADLERMAFSIGEQSPWTKRVSLTAPVAFGLDIMALAEQSPFVSIGSAASPWMTAVRIQHSTYLPRPIASGETHVVFRDLDGNGLRDRGESGVAGLVVRCGDRTAVTDRDGRFKCDAGQAWEIEPRSVPMGWVAPATRREHRVAGDIGLIEMKAVEVQIDLTEVDTVRVPRAEFAKLLIAARDTAGQPYFARSLSGARFVFDALPPGRYTVDVDASGIDEPLRMRGTPEFTVGEGSSAGVRVMMTGRAMRVRVLPPTQAGGAGADAPGKAAGGSSSGANGTSGATGPSGRSTSKETK